MKDKTKYLSFETFNDIFNEFLEYLKLEEVSTEKIDYSSESFYNIVRAIKFDGNGISKPNGQMIRMLKENNILPADSEILQHISDLTEKLSYQLPSNETKISAITFTGTGEQAAEIFELINRTGKPLTSTEILASR